MNIVLLSGGSGKRLWPLSNDIRSKQFIKIFRNEDGSYESMLQRMYRQIKAVDDKAVVTVATSKSQASTIYNQLGNDIGVSIEPCRKDTFPAIVLAAAYMVDVLDKSPEEAVVICPVDPYVDSDYFETLKVIFDRVSSGQENLVLMGVQPTFATAKYGYIFPKSCDKFSEVKSFKEKPTERQAQDYIKEGALWNGGVFGFKLKYILEKAHALIDFEDYSDLYNKYELLNKISFDYAIVEQEERMSVTRFSGEWKDLGTWNTFTEAMGENIIGDGIMDDSCTDVHIINEMDVPVIAMGLNDVVISTSPNGILVSDKEQSSYIKPYVDKLNQQVMFADKSWGNYKVIDVENGSHTIKVTLNAGRGCGQNPGHLIT